jgi:signal peptidase I
LYASDFRELNEQSRNIQMKKIVRKFWQENRAFVLIVLGMAFFRTAIADWSPVPSGSMEPSIWPGDVLLINKTLLGPNVPFTEGRLLQFDGPQRGDIVTFTPPDKSQSYVKHDGDIVTFNPPEKIETFVKRVVGLPGDRIRMKGFQLIINDQPVPLTITDRGETSGILRATEQLGEHSHGIQLDLHYGIKPIDDELVVPADSYFMMGDNRNGSEDSRYFGFVHKDRLIGKVTRIAVSVASERHWWQAPLTRLD